MHEIPFSPNNNDDELFKQLADLGLDDLQKDIDYALEEITQTEENLHRQQRVIQHLKEKHPIFAEFLAPFSTELKIEMYEAALKYRTWRHNHPNLPDDILLRVLFAEAICTHIYKISDVLAEIGDKTDTQVGIITDDITSPDLKTVLLEALHELAPAGGIDTNDADEVHRAINQHQADKQTDDHNKALRKQISKLLRLHEHELLEQYNIHPKDPIWSEIRAWSTINISLRAIHSSNQDIFEFGIRERLTTLRINEADYLALVTKVEGLIEK